jgi:hypothetical protein
LKANAVVFSHRATHCPDQYAFVLVPSAALIVSNKVATVSTPSVVGKLVGELKFDEQGYQYFCVE